ncbi:MAG: hypothetical protein COC06_11200 [Bacteroidales bacterium]|nr:MAG: hypothetical protein COC06_11200 [Bacteroidales bacterium]
MANFELQRYKKAQNNKFQVKNLRIDQEGKSCLRYHTCCLFGRKHVISLLKNLPPDVRITFLLAKSVMAQPLIK